MLTNQELAEAFVNANLEEEHNLLIDDLRKLADSFIAKAQPRVAREERDACIDVVRSLNPLVANKLAEIRGRS